MSHQTKSHAKNNAVLGQNIGASRNELVHRTSCHRCGNIRKNPILCNACVMTFCLCCEKKLIAQYGEDAFIGGCVFCKKLCCCVNKEDMNYTCLNDLHCYKKCVIYRNRKRLMDFKPTPGVTLAPSTPLSASLTVSTQTRTSDRRLTVDRGSTYTPTTSISSGLYDTNASFLASSLGMSGGAAGGYSLPSNCSSGGVSPFNNPWSIRDLCMETPDHTSIIAATVGINLHPLSPMQYFISPIVSPLSPIVSPLSPTESVILTRAMLGDNGEKPSPCPVRVDLRGHDDEDFFTKSYRANFTC